MRYGLIARHLVFCHKGLCSPYTIGRGRPGGRFHGGFAIGVHAPYTLRTVVQLRTDTSLTGLGEAYGGTTPLRDLETVRERVVGRICTASPASRRPS